MKKEEWEQCSNIIKMLDVLWKTYPENKVVPILHRFFLRCARNIEILLPQKESLRGIEIGEKFISGEVDLKCLNDENWSVEGAAFMFEYNTNPELIEQWIQELKLIRSEDIDNVLYQEKFRNINAHDLLQDAAYFVDHAMIFPTCSHKKSVSKSHIKFLQPNFLREIVDYPSPNTNA